MAGGKILDQLGTPDRRGCRADGRSLFVGALLDAHKGHLPDLFASFLDGKIIEPGKHVKDG
jgi:hypothetical protein